MDPLTGREGGGLKTRKLLLKKFNYNFGKRLRIVVCHHVSLLTCS